jgi:hypothetical protein
MTRSSNEWAQTLRLPLRPLCTQARLNHKMGIQKLGKPTTGGFTVEPGLTRSVSCRVNPWLQILAGSHRQELLPTVCGLAWTPLEGITGRLSGPHPPPPTRVFAVGGLRQSFGYLDYPALSCGKISQSSRGR